MTENASKNPRSYMFEGDLYVDESILRHGYCLHYKTIDSVDKLKATLRAGEFTGIGGYKIFFITQDGEALSYDGMKKRFRDIIEDFSSGDLIMCTHIGETDARYECDETGEVIRESWTEEE